MKFLFPLGLLGLLGIPILILIYIIKSKYAEQTVASTYLWTLSEKFLKRKRPVSPLTGIISLLLQILSVAAISLIIAHPIITIPNSAQEYCFVLDASGSMNMESEGVSRFDRAKEEIEDLIRASTDGSRYSLIVVSDVTTTVYEQTTDKKQALELLAATQGGDVVADYTSALETAQSYFAENGGVRTYLVTDTTYETAENIEIINVAAKEQNVGIGNVLWDLSGGQLTLNGTVRTWSNAETLTVSLYADGGETPIATTAVQTEAGVSVPFEIKTTLLTFTSLRLTLTGSEHNDLSADDEYMIYNIKSDDVYRILLVSDTPYFIQTAFSAIGHKDITVKSPKEYSAVTDRGYGLYIFECCTPTELPNDGAVWFFDPQGSVPNAGFSVQGEVALSRGETIELTESTASAAQTMIEHLSGAEIYITEYVKCSLYRNFTTLFSYKGNPLVFAGTNALGHREVVFAFDLHHSNLPLLIDYIILTQNLMTYSFPDVLEKVNYDAGDEATINVIANCDSIRVDSPSGEVLYLSTDAATAKMTLGEVGSYRVTVTVSDIPRVYYLYASMPEEEREPAPTETGIALHGQASEGGFDGTFDPLTILFICLALLFLADWMVYCYEKYQLR